MKKTLICAAIFVMAMSLFCSVSMAELVMDSYTDTPANPTQDNVAKMQAVMTRPGEDPEAYTILTMEPTRATIHLLGELFDFVNINQVPPTRWFPEETQLAIREILKGGDPDILYISEIFSALPQREKQPGDVVIDMLMNVDYAPGMMIVMALGVETENGIDWFVCRGDVLVDDTIHYTIPADAAARLAGRETLTVLLTVKPDKSGQESAMIRRPEPTFVPSKSGENLTYVEDTVFISGVGDAEDCRIVIVSKPEPAREELARFTGWMAESGKAPIAYFDDKIRSEIGLLLENTDLSTLLPYEVECVMAENYQEPYGDVMARFRFPSAFQPEKKTVSLLGMPQENGSFEWTVLYTEINGLFAEITFSSTVLPDMMKKPGLVLVFSEPIIE